MTHDLGFRSVLKLKFINGQIKRLDLNRFSLLRSIVNEHDLKLFCFDMQSDYPLFILTFLLNSLSCLTPNIQWNRLNKIQLYFFLTNLIKSKFLFSFSPLSFSIIQTMDLKFDFCQNRILGILFYLNARVACNLFNAQVRLV